MTRMCLNVIMHIVSLIKNICVFVSLQSKCSFWHGKSPTGHLCCGGQGFSGQVSDMSHGKVCKLTQGISGKKRIQKNSL